MPEKRLALVHQPAMAGTGANVFGATVANREMFQALIRYGGLDRVDFLTPSPMTAESIVVNLLDGEAPRTTLGWADILNPSAAKDAGALFRGGPRLDELAWLRRSASMEKDFSLIGLIHTIAPLPMRHDIAGTTITPIHPWDALVCTSPSVKSAVERLFDDWVEYLRERLGPVNPPRPLLPLLPLGVNGDRFAQDADRPPVRKAMRESLGCGPDDILVIWVGRLSFFEKAFPQPMFRAIAEAAAATGRRLHFAMVGWFPDPTTGDAMYRAAAAAYGPEVEFHIMDGNDRDVVGRMWAAADVFISLVDNIQETFGITPLEAMASGLPVVVSDWDGYRYTVRDGEEGMLVPTLIGAETGAPAELLAGHAFGSKTYQQYVGVLAQHTAVDVGAAAAALTALIQSPDLRRSMGDAGRRRIRDMFDWKVVAPQYVALVGELAEIRRSGPAPAAGHKRHPTKGDPFRDFAGFATATLSARTMLALRPGVGLADLDRSAGLALDMFGGNWRGTHGECQALLGLLDGGPRSVGELLASFPKARGRRVQLSLLWMCKLGLLSWG